MAGEQASETVQQKNARRRGQCGAVRAGDKPCNCEAYEPGRTIDGYVRCVCDHTQGVHRVTGEAHGN